MEIIIRPSDIMYQVSVASNYVGYLTIFDIKQFDNCLVICAAGGEELSIVAKC